MSHLKIPGTKRVTRSMFRIEDSEISGPAVQNLAAWATWRPRFVHPCFMLNANFQ